MCQHRSRGKGLGCADGKDTRLSITEPRQEPQQSRLGTWVPWPRAQPSRFFLPWGPGQSFSKCSPQANSLNITTDGGYKFESQSLPVAELINKTIQMGSCGSEPMTLSRHPGAPEGLKARIRLSCFILQGFSSSFMLYRIYNKHPFHI